MVSQYSVFLWPSRPFASENVTCTIRSSRCGGKLEKFALGRKSAANGGGNDGTEAEGGGVYGGGAGIFSSRMIMVGDANVNR